MTEHSYSVEDIINFLKSAQTSGILKFNTARTRRTAITQLSRFFTDSQRADLRNIDKKALADRIRNNSDIQEGTIQTYLTRLDKSITAYTSYIEGDITEPNHSTELKTKPQNHDSQPKETVFVVLDSNAAIRISNIPKHLSRQDAEKIYSALLLLVNEQQKIE